MSAPRLSLSALDRHDGSIRRGPVEEKPTAYPLGIDYVLANGQMVIDQGRHTGAKPGSVLRGAGSP